MSLVLLKVNDMAKRTIHCEELGACEICANCVEQRHPWYYCGCGNEDFGDIDYPNECDDFEHLDDDEDEDEYDDFDPNEPIECPRCGDDAYWNGSNYECDNCGWCGFPDED